MDSFSCVGSLAEVTFPSNGRMQSLVIIALTAAAAVTAAPATIESDENFLKLTSPTDGVILLDGANINVRSLYAIV